MPSYDDLIPTLVFRLHGWSVYRERDIDENLIYWTQAPCGQCFDVDSPRAAREAIKRTAIAWTER